MDEPGKGNASPSGNDGDRVRVTEHGSGGARSALFYKSIALILIGCFATYLVSMTIDRTASKAAKMSSDDSVSEVDAADESDATSSRATTMRNRQLTARPVQPLHDPHDPDDLSNFVLPGQPAPKMEDVIDELHKVGIQSGLGAFPPPGTSPPLVGLAVPDDYVMPEGYVRHTQATDDGQRIEAILMYSPDFEFFDSAGRRIEIPQNRVVPADMAPPGLPIRLIEIPAPLDSGSPPI